VTTGMSMHVWSRLEERTQKIRGKERTPNDRTKKWVVSLIRLSGDRGRKNSQKKGGEQGNINELRKKGKI